MPEDAARRGKRAADDGEERPETRASGTASGHLRHRCAARILAQQSSHLPEDAGSPIAFTNFLLGSA